MNDLVKDVIELEIIKSNKEFVCCLCNKNFVYKDVVGQLQCWYHPMDFDQYSDKYRCCGRKYNTQGCRRSDHTTNPFYGDDSVMIHLYMYIEHIYKNPRFVDISKIPVKIINNERFSIIKVREKY